MNTGKGAQSYAQALQRFCDDLLAENPAVAPYCTNYTGGHGRALQAVYPRVRKQLGETVFAALAAVYARHYPAREWDLNLYGDRFHELLAAQVLGARGDDFPWGHLAQLARREYQATLDYYADDPPGRGAA